MRGHAADHALDTRACVVNFDVAAFLRFQPS